MKTGKVKKKRTKEDEFERRRDQRRKCKRREKKRRKEKRRKSFQKKIITIMGEETNFKKKRLTQENRQEGKGPGERRKENETRRDAKSTRIKLGKSTRKKRRKP